MENYEKVYLVVAGMMSWTCAFLLTRKIFPKWSFDLCKRMVSTIHAVYAVVFCSISVQDWRYPLASNTSPLQMRVLAPSLAYFIYDLVCCWLDNNLSIDNLGHHLVSIVGIAAGLAYETSGSQIMAILWITEISSPCLHLRKLIKELGYNNTKLNLAADVSFAVTFILARFGFGTYVFFVTILSNIPIIIKVAAVGLALVSKFWLYKIAKMVKHKLITKSTSKTVQLV